MNPRAPDRPVPPRRRRDEPPHAAERVDYEFQVYVLPSARAVARCAAATILDEARRAIARRGRFVVAIPGGATPRPLLAQLAAAARTQEFDWSLVTFVWADERRVPYRSRDSNAGAAVRHGLGKLLGARLLPMPVDADPDGDARAYERTLRELLRAPGGRPAPIDLVVLGVGADGHVASLFPHSPALAAGRRWVVPATAPAGIAERLTLTLPVLRAARLRLVLVTGAAKRDMVARALAPARNAELLPGAPCRRDPPPHRLADRPGGGGRRRALITAGTIGHSSGVAVDAGCESRCPAGFQAVDPGLEIDERPLEGDDTVIQLGVRELDHRPQLREVGLVLGLKLREPMIDSIKPFLETTLSFLETILSFLEMILSFLEMTLSFLEMTLPLLEAIQSRSLCCEVVRRLRLERYQPLLDSDKPLVLRVKSLAQTAEALREHAMTLRDHTGLRLEMLRQSPQ